PIVRAVLGLQRIEGAGCGVRTVRITPRGAVVPCVYGADDALSVDDLERLGSSIVDEASFARLRAVPEPCLPCPHVTTCGGGWGSRRQLNGGLDQPDEYCPFVRGDRTGLPVVSAGSARQRPKAASACTTIVELRRKPFSVGERRE